jgi:hypothetical protein
LSPERQVLTVERFAFPVERRVSPVERLILATERSVFPVERLVFAVESRVHPTDANSGAESTYSPRRRTAMPRILIRHCPV